ncbi:PQQ-binding-like beta-propeller repeat protein [Pseudogemmatithrix spongiicola]|uniref:PQQ-binding-like beta-propeller repeat protein n=1 Tax=Pseudogemmatithrix spongiicola TaxID=3062599 RepID=A0AA49JXR3_9BACT|nr:PQQ-binding-like beta-propeller repeat protein [Gemmatimonadaceae bacterium 'strain 138']WKW13951.1 PQQ-binding-like beta-propeller repeat protein [Gemmatimonadaceae bacterium 'strain 318']
MPPVGTDGDPRVLWRVPSGADARPHEPVANADGSMVYFLNSAYRLQKIRATDGHVVWDRSGGVPRQNGASWNLVRSAHVVVAPRVDLYAFDTTSGQPAWTYVDPELDETGYSTIAADSQTVYAASRLGKIHAVAAGSGTARWIVDLKTGEVSVGALRPTLHHSLLLVCSRTLDGPSRGTLWALNTADGSVRWRYDFQPELPGQGSACFGHAASMGDVAIQAQEDGRVFAFELSTGVVRWVAPRVHDVTSGLGDSRYAAAGSGVFVVTSIADRGLVVAYDPVDGREIWRYTENGGSPSPALIADGSVWVDHGYRYASYDAATGRLLWQTPAVFGAPPTVYSGRPVVGADRIFVAGRDGSYALVK